MGRVINTTSANLDKYRKDQIRKMRELVVDTVTDIEIEATREAPVSEDGDHFIHIDKRFTNNDLTGEVGVMGENNLAAYFEFGTGLSAREILAPYPQWIKDIAWKFFVTGKGTLKGKPYLYPNVLKGIPVFQRELKTLIDKDVKDNG
jgi:hypothetical protein